MYIYPSKYLTRYISLYLYISIYAYINIHINLSNQPEDRILKVLPGTGAYRGAALFGGATAPTPSAPGVAAPKKIARGKVGALAISINFFARPCVWLDKLQEKSKLVHPPH